MTKQEKALKKMESLTYDLEAALDTIDSRRSAELALSHEDWYDLQVQILNLRITVTNLHE